MAKVLVVDDSPVIRGIVGHLLEDLQHAPIFASNGIDALVEIEDREIAAVITDIHMPEMDGLVLIRKLRALEDFKSKPILVLTTEHNIKIREAAVNAGATGDINKPIEKDKFRRMVKRAIC